MQKPLILFILPIFFLMLNALPEAMAQDVEVALGPDEIALNQAFTITVTVSNGRLQSYEGFPEIAGFLKRGTSSSSSTNIINGQMSSSQSLTQNYIPHREGVFTVDPFQMKVNGQDVDVDGKSIKVGPPVQARQQTDPFGSDPFDNFFRRQREPQQFMDVKEDAFLSFTIDKNEVYVGEGFTVTLAFYVAAANRAPLQFHNLGNQLAEILKKIRPANSWEENFNIDEISGQNVTINNKKYLQYKIYQANYYPFNLEDVKFPSVGLEMIKYNVAQNPSFFGQSQQEDYKTFYSKAKTVKVKPLPPHPLKDQVAVGNYTLRESINSKELNTGESFTYNFTIAGEGNISAIDNPEPPENDTFDFYTPSSKQTINRNGNRVTGAKSFSYYGIPNEPGTYDLGNYFSWVFFNPSSNKYDTLTSDITLNVKGESKKNEYILSNDMGSFYDIIGTESNNLVSRNRDEMIKMFANIFILVMLVLTGIVLFKK